MKKIALSLAVSILAMTPCAATIRTMAVDDENRNPNWDWTDPSPQTLYSCNGSGQIQKHIERLPFFTPGNSMNAYGESDMRKEDGWILVHRDFGTSEIAQPFPFFTLYNKYRGLFRVMLFNAMAREGSLFQGDLHFLDGSRFQAARAGLFTFADGRPSKTSLADYDPDFTLTAFSEMTTYGAWSVFDYPLLGYDKDLAARDPILVFRLTSLEKQAIKLKTAGEIQLYQTIQRDSGARLGKQTSAGTAAATARGMYEIGKKGYGTYKTVKSFLDAEILSDSGQEKHRNAAWFKPVSELAASRVGKVVPYLAAMASVLESFVGGANTAAEWEPLNFTGQLQLDTQGALQTTRNLWCHNLFLNRSDQEDGRAQRPVNAVPWGIFNFKKLPSIKSTGSLPEELTKGVQANIRIAKAPELILNPDTGLDLVSKRVAFILNDVDRSIESKETRMAHSKFMSFAEAMDDGFAFNNHSQSFGNGSGLLWELKFKTRVPTVHSDREIIIFKKTDFIDENLEEVTAHFRAKPQPLSTLKIQI